MKKSKQLETIDRRIAKAEQDLNSLYEQRREIINQNNLNKAILDSLTHSKVIVDDKYIDDLRIVRAGYEKNNGRVEIYISEIEG